MGSCNENKPFKLPNDYKSFLELSEGILLKWSIKHQGEVMPFGCLHLNPLSSVIPIEVPKELSHFQAPKRCENQNDEATVDTEGSLFECLPKAFELDNSCPDGRIALVYLTDYSNPSVWFQDLGCEWNFVAANFMDYFRLLVLHFGVPHWLYAFTKTGLDPVTKQWLRFLTPKRLQVDLNKTLSCKQPRKLRKKKVNLARIDKYVKKEKDRTLKQQSRQRHRNTNLKTLEKLQSNKRRPGTAPVFN